MAFKEILQAKNKKELQKAVENFIRIEDIVEYKFPQFSLQQLAVNYPPRLERRGFFPSIILLNQK